MLLQLDKIHKQFDEKIAVNQLSLGIPKGAIYGIIGPNGAGKTTTIRMIMNIFAPDSGAILFEGKPIDDSFQDRVGYLPEERGLYKKMTLRDVIVYMAELKNFPKARTDQQIDKWLRQFDLLDYKDRKVEDLSKGMAQKLQFITTVIHDPEIIILDELFSGLDPINIETIKDCLLDLKRNGKTILFSTHVMEQAEKLCEYICMISDGKKVLDGKMTDVKAQFGKNALQVVIDGDGSFIKGFPGVAGVTDSTNYLEIRLEEGADPNQLIRKIVEQVPVSRFELVEPSLYDIFIDTAKVSRTKLLGEGQEVPRV